MQHLSSRPDLRKFAWLIPAIGLVVLIATPFARHLQRMHAEALAEEFFPALYAAQQAFHRQTGGYAASLESLTVSCGGQTEVLPSNAVTRLGRAGYEVRLRVTEWAGAGPPDCHGRATVLDYYAAAAPRDLTSHGHLAFAMTSTGDVFVFFDGIPPVEGDMGPDGLATRLGALDTFRIP